MIDRVCYQRDKEGTFGLFFEQFKNRSMVIYLMYNFLSKMQGPKPSHPSSVTSMFSLVPMVPIPMKAGNMSKVIPGFKTVDRLTNSFFYSPHISETRNDKKGLES